MSKSNRYTWSAHGAKWPMLNIIDWYAEGGPQVVACVPQSDDFQQLAAEAAVRLLSSDI